MNRDFYSSFATYYDSIFSLSDSEKNFYGSYAISRSSRALDIGCGTGDLVLLLSRKAGDVLGIDIDPSMLAIAKGKSGGARNVRFYNADMLDLGSITRKSRFDFVFCMGNTLAHLGSISELFIVFSSIKSILRASGTFVFQILNYSKILDMSVTELPVIENDALVFKRTYMLKENKKLAFYASLTIKKTQETFSSTGELIGLTLADIAKTAEEAGLRITETFGSFQKEQFEDNSGLLVCEITKD